MFPILIPIIDSDLQWPVLVTIAERSHGDLRFGPDGIQGIVDLDGFPHYSVPTIFVQAEKCVCVCSESE